MSNESEDGMVSNSMIITLMFKPIGILIQKSYRKGWMDGQINERSAQYFESVYDQSMSVCFYHVNVSFPMLKVRRSCSVLYASTVGTRHQVDSIS
jgi:hypothetical protein